MEQVISQLIEVYKQNGYTLFKGGIFEDYDWYYQNREYIDDTKILKVIQPNGKLLGIQADLTISALKSYMNQRNPYLSSQKYFYYSNTYENVFGKQQEIKKHKVIGIEYFGSEDDLGEAEVLILAHKTLQSFRRPFVLELSLSNVLKQSVDRCTESTTLKQNILELISARNFHGLRSLLERSRVAETDIGDLTALSQIRGSYAEVIEQLGQLKTSNELRSIIATFTALYAYLEEARLDQEIKIDLSLLNKQNYYDGLIFQGFVEGINKPIMRGGRYNALRGSNNRQFTSVGFTLELDDILVKKYSNEKADLIILYQQPHPKILSIISDYQNRGLQVFALSSGQVIDLDRLRSTTIELKEFDAQTLTLKEI